METVGKRLEKAPIEIRYAYQELHKIPEGCSIPADRTKPLGTGHAILCAKEVVGDAPFVVLNSDDYYGKSAFKVVYDYLCQAEDKDTYDFCMAGYQLCKTVSDHGSVARGVCETDEESNLTNIVERLRIEKYEDGIHFTEDGETWTDLEPETPVSMNMFGFTPVFMDELEARFPAFLKEELPENPAKKEFLLPMIVGQLLKEGKANVKVLRTADKWYGVTYAADKPIVVAALREMTEQGMYPQNLWGNK